MKKLKLFLVGLSLITFSNFAFAMEKTNNENLQNTQYGKIEISGDIGKIKKENKMQKEMNNENNELSEIGYLIKKKSFAETKIMDPQQLEEEKQRLNIKSDVEKISVEPNKENFENTKYEKIKISDNIAQNKKENKKENINISLSPTSPSQRIIAGGKAREREREKSDFDLFWDAYPKKDGLNAASDAWISAVEAGDIKYGDGAMIAEAVERAKTSRQWTQDGGRYIPMPVRYIAERRWTDQGTTLPDTTREASFDTSAFFAAAVEASEAQMKALAGDDG